MNIFIFIGMLDIYNVNVTYIIKDGIILNAEYFDAQSILRVYPNKYTYVYII